MVYILGTKGTILLFFNGFDGKRHCHNIAFVIHFKVLNAAFDMRDRNYEYTLLFSLPFFLAAPLV